MNRMSGERAVPQAAGRRPLLSTFVGNNRHMLQEIRDNLSHLRKNQEGNAADLANIKPELSQSTPNLVDKSAAKMTRLDLYHQKALAEIRDSLRPFQTVSDTSSTASSSSSSQANGDIDVNKQMLQQLVACGIDEVRTR